MYVKCMLSYPYKYHYITGMIERKSGAILNISGIGSMRGVSPGAIVYSSGQGALDQMTRCMAVELGPHQIHVNTIQPMLLPTTPMGKYAVAVEPGLDDAIIERTPLGRIGVELDDVVNAIMYLLSDKADMINGAILPIDGGWLCT